MRGVLLTLGLFGATSALYIPPDGLNKCDMADSLGVVMCIAPVSSIFDRSPSNFTRARGIRMVEECRNTTTCISQYECASKVRLDKMFGVLCDAFAFLSTEFAPCQKKIDALNPPCIKEAEKMFHNHENLKNPCDLINSNKLCIKNEVSTICGERYWHSIVEIFKRMESYSILKCNVSFYDDVETNSIDSEEEATN